MKIPSIFFLTILLAVFTFTGCSESSSTSSGGTDYVQGDGSATPDIPVSTGNMNTAQILEEGVKSLKAEKWDEAIAYYNAAYAKDGNNIEAIIYSTLANLAKISTDKDVIALIKNNFGFTTYPDKLNALFSKSWMTKMPEDYPIYSYYDGTYWSYWREAKYDDVSKDGYYRYDYNSGGLILVSTTAKYDSTYMPVIRTPEWVKGSGSIYNETLLSGNIMSTESWAIALLANIVDRNVSGFNQTLDEVISSVFGASYNEAIRRLQKLENRKSETITLNPDFIKKLGLEEMFDEYDEIGWAELNAVISAMLAMKASLEWISSYDLNTDLNWLKYAWKADENDILNRVRNIPKSSLPFNNNFLKVRADGANRMNKAKATYKTAIQGLQASYQVIASPNSIYPTKVKDTYNTVNGGFNALLSAIDAGGKFYIPEDPTKGTWPTSGPVGGNVIGMIDFGKFFELGRLSLDKIFETNSGKPELYACNWHYDYSSYTEELRGVKLDLNNYKSLLEERDDDYYYDDEYKYELCLKLKMDYIKQLVDEKELSAEFENGLVSTDIEGEFAKVLFEKYYK